jgi:hypothetical protein
MIADLLKTLLRICNLIVAVCTVYRLYDTITLTTASLETSTLWAHLGYYTGLGRRESSSIVSNRMSDNGDEVVYTTTKEDGSVTIEPDGHISADNIDDITFSFADGVDITESVAKKNAKNKTPVSFTNRGRSAYTPITVTYPDGSTSSKFLLENCILQWTPALNTPNHSYAKDFVFVGIPSMYLDKIMKDAAINSSITLQNKPNVQEFNGYYWLRCNLDKLSHKDCQIVTPDGPVKLNVDTILTEMKKSVIASIMFTLSGSMTNNNMSEELDLKDGTYTITMKPTEVYAVSDTDIKGPELTDTNNRKKEGSAMSDTFFASGALAAMAAKRIRKPAQK